MRRASERWGRTLKVERRAARFAALLEQSSFGAQSGFGYHRGVVSFYVGIFTGTLSTVALPIPEEVVLLGAGYGARLGHASLPLCVAAAWTAVMLGDSAGYFFGRKLLGRILRTQYGERILPRESRIWAERLVTARGAQAIVLARFLVGMRGFVYFAIGASGLPFARFLVVNGLAALLEVSLVVAIGFAFGELRESVGRGVDLLVVAVLLGVFCGPRLVRFLVQRRRANPIDRLED